MIKREIIDLIVDTAVIEEVVTDFVTLKKRGTNLIGLCPFHNEKTPSFNVNPARNIYKCFGCGRGGDSVSFIMEHETVSYPEALRHLASKYNIDIEEDEKSPERTEEELLRESLLSVTSFAQKYFSDNLNNSEEGQTIGHSYFKERDISDHSISKFHLGYASESWSEFSDAANEAGYKKEFLKKTGLTIYKENKHYDRFRGRVLFPIHTISGKVIAFGGRTLLSDKKIPKYVNSPESEIYHKSKVLYGLFYAKKAISQKDECFLVEGYTDVITMHQSGIENVVASSGTALTTDQIRLIGRYTKNITVLYDGDPAGIKASLRGIDLILENNLNVRVVLFPEGQDPDSFARKHSNSEVQHYIQENKKDFIRFKTSLLLDEVNHDPLSKAKLIREILFSISLIPDSITRSSYIKECSYLMDMSEQVLISELNKIIRQNFKKKSSTVAEIHVEDDPLVMPEQTIDEDYVHYHETDIIRLLLNYGDHEIIFEEETEQGQTQVTQTVKSFIINELVIDEIFPANPVLRKIFDEFIKMVHDNSDYNPTYFIRHDDAEVRQLSTDMLSPKYNISENWASKGITIKPEVQLLQHAVESSIYTLKTGRVEQMLEENRTLIKTADDSQLEILLQRHNELEEIKSMLAEKRGIVIL